MLPSEKETKLSWSSSVWWGVAGFMLVSALARDWDVMAVVGSFVIGGHFFLIGVVEIWRRM